MYRYKILHIIFQFKLNSSERVKIVLGSLYFGLSNKTKKSNI